MSNASNIFPEIDKFEEGTVWFLINDSTAKKMKAVEIAMRYCDNLEIHQDGSLSGAWLLILSGDVAFGVHQIAALAEDGHFGPWSVSEWNKRPLRLW